MTSLPNSSMATAALRPSNSSTSVRPLEEDEFGLILHVVLSVQVFLASIGFLINCALLIGQIRSSNWPRTQRVLFINVTTAAAISTLIHAAQGGFQLHKHIALDEGGGLDGNEQWSDRVADSAQTAVAIGMAVLAYQNLLALRTCEKQMHKTTRQESSKLLNVCCISTTIALVWMLAVGFVAGELNPQAQIYSEMKTNISAYLSFVIGLLIEFSVTCTVLITRRRLRKLQTDFVVHRVQQNLAVRVHIKETISLTSAVSRVLLLHVTIWAASIATGFGINRYLRSFVRDKNDIDGDADFDNKLAAFTAVVDAMVMSFDVSYPLVVLWRQPQLQSRMGLDRLSKMITCHRPSISRESPIQSMKELAVIPAASTGLAQAHFGAVGSHWDRVADVKFKASGSGMMKKATSVEGRSKEGGDLSSKSDGGKRNSWL